MNLRWSIIGTFLSYACFGQDSINPIKTLDEVIISATRSALSYRQIAQTVKSISSEEISRSMPQTVAELFQKTGVITVQKSQQGGGSPILRGLEANRILLVVDGIRLNNIIYRGGHLQNVITIDPNFLDKAEVLFGPASSVYGSDAMGGVIHLITKKPVLGADKFWTSGVSTRYSSVNQEKMVHYDGSWSKDYWGALVSATYTDYGDLNGGRNKNSFYHHRYGYRHNYYVFENGQDILKTNDKPWKQIASGYRQLDLLGKFRFTPGHQQDHIINVQFSTSSDIPRYDRLTDPDSKTVLRNAEWFYGPQKRFLVSYTGDFQTAFPLKINVNYQQIEESRHNRRVGNYNLQRRMENVDVLGFDVMHQNNNDKRQLIAGMDAQFEQVSSTAYQENLNSGATAAIDTRYPQGGNHMVRLGIYGMQTNYLSERWTLQEGLRFGFTTLSSLFGTKQFFNFPFDQVKQSNLTYSGNFGVSYHPSPRTKWGAVLASGFRVPNVDDVAKVFESVPGSLVVPNPDLKPEKSLTAEWNVFHSGIDNRSHLQISTYLTYLFDAIVSSPFKFNGSDSVVYNNVKSRVLSNQNKRRARVAGFSVEGQTPLTEEILLRIGGSMTHGRILDAEGNTPLDHIPPLSGIAGLSYNRNKLNLEFNTLFNGWKHLDQYLLAAEDNEAYATPEGMPAWLILNAYGGYDFSGAFRIQLSLENILDTGYRVFASGINAPGRNLSLMLKAKF